MLDPVPVAAGFMVEGIPLEWNGGDRNDGYRILVGDDFQLPWHEAPEDWTPEPERRRLELKQRGGGGVIVLLCRNPFRRN